MKSGVGVFIEQNAPAPDVILADAYWQLWSSANPRAPTFPGRTEYSLPSCWEKAMTVPPDDTNSSMAAFRLSERYQSERDPLGTISRRKFESPRGASSGRSRAAGSAPPMRAAAPLA